MTLKNVSCRKPRTVCLGAFACWKLQDTNTQHAEPALHPACTAVVFED